MEEIPGQPAPVPAPDQNPQVVQSGGGGTSWSKIIITVVVVIVLMEVIAGVEGVFILTGTTDVSDLSGHVPKLDIHCCTE